MNIFKNRTRQVVWILLLSSCILFSYTVPSSQEYIVQGGEVSLVKWMSFEEALNKSQTEKRKIFIDVYTDWCGWCKVMDQKTFNEPHVAKRLNEQFYPVKFNAEQLQDIVFKGTTYRFVPHGRRGYHQLAALLLNNNMSYPTVVFLEEDFSQSYPVMGYRKPDEFYPLLVFFGEDHHKKSKNPWEEFQKGYKSPF